MNFRSITHLLLLTLVVYFQSCSPPGGGQSGNEEVANQTFGLRMSKIHGDNQLDLAPYAESSNLVLQVTDYDGSPAGDLEVKFEWLSESHADPDCQDSLLHLGLILTDSMQTDEFGLAKTSVEIPGGIEKCFYERSFQVRAFIQDTRVEAIFNLRTMKAGDASRLRILGSEKTQVNSDLTVFVQAQDKLGMMVNGYSPPAGVVVTMYKVDPDTGASLGDIGDVNFTGSTGTVTMNEPTPGTYYLQLKESNGSTGLDITEFADTDGDGVEEPRKFQEIAEFVEDKGDRLVIVDRNDVTLLHKSGATFTDWSEAAWVYSDSNDVALSYGSGDIIYVGIVNKFDALRAEMSLDSLTNQSMTVSYWNGTSFTNVPNLIDNTNAFQKKGFIMWDEPVDWEKTSINSTELYWIAITLPNGFTTTMKGFNAVYTVADFLGIRIEAQDSLGVLQPYWNGQVTLDHTGQLEIEDNGIIEVKEGLGNALVNDFFTETVKLSLLDHTGTLVGKDITSSQELIFYAEKVDQLLLADPGDGSIQTPITLNVVAIDQYGNRNIGWEKDITLKVTGSATFGARDNGVQEYVVDIIEGMGTVELYNSEVETVTVSLDGNALATPISTTDPSVSWNVVREVFFDVGDASKVVILDPVDGTVDNPIDVTLQVQDDWDNIVTSFNGDIELVADGSASGDGVLSFMSGEVTIALIDTFAETVNLSLADVNSSGFDLTSTQDVVFAPGAPAKFYMQNPLDTIVGQTEIINVEVHDQFGNLTTGFEDDVKIVMDSPNASLSSAGIVNITNSTGSINIYDETNETIWLRLDDSVANTNLDITSSQDIIFDSGAVAQYAVLNPADSDVDTPANIIVQAQDSFGNRVYGHNYGNLALNTIGSSATGAGPVSIVDGQGSITISDQVVETVDLTLADSGGSGLTLVGEDIYFGAGAIHEIRVVDPADASTDSPATVELEIVDQYGNICYYFNGPGTVDLQSTGSAVVNGGNPTVTFVDGIATTTVEDTVVETVILSLTNSTDNLVIDSTQDLFFDVGAPHHFSIIDPTDDTVDNNITLRIEAQDLHNNMVPNYNSDVDLNADSPITPTAPSTVDIVNGFAEIPIHSTLAGTFMLRLTNPQQAGMLVDSTQDVTFGPGEVAQYAIIDPADGTVDDPVEVTIEAQDQYGNKNPAWNTDVSLRARTGSYSGGITYSPPTQLINILAGAGIIYVEDTLEETIVLELYDSQGTGKNVDSTQDLFFAAGEATQFYIMDPTDGTIDSPADVTIEARDQFGNTARSYTGSVKLVAGGNAVESNGGRVDLVNGEGTIQVTDTVAETVPLHMLDNFGTGLDVSHTEDVIFGPGLPVAFIINNPDDADTDTAGLVSVKVVDSGGNTVPTYNDDVTVNVDGNATIDNSGLVDISNGTGSINVYDDTVETVNLTLIDSQGTLLNIDSTEDIIFYAGFPAQIVIDDPVDGTTDAPVQVKVRALDIDGNLVTAYNKDVDIVATGNAFGDGKVDIVNGVGLINISNTTAETIELSLVDSYGTLLDVSSTQDLIFDVGTPAKFTIIDPVDATVDDVINVYVEAQDINGNRAWSYSSTVTLDADGDAFDDGVVTITNGQGFIGIQDHTAETVNLTLIDSASTNMDVESTQDVIFVAGEVTKYVILDPVDGTTDNPVGVLVQAQDQYGNRNFTYHTDVRLNADGSATGDGVVNIISGQGVREISDTVVETVNLTLVDSLGTLKNVDSTQDLVFEAGEPHHYFIKDPLDVTTDDPAVVTIEVQDINNNVATSFNDDLTLVADPSTTITNTGTFTVTSGTATLNLTNTKAETVVLTIDDHLNHGLENLTTQDVVFVGGTPVEYVIVNPADGTVDDPIKVTINAVDAYGNIAVTHDGSVTLDTTGSATGFGVVTVTDGVGTKNISDNVMETVILTLIATPDGLVFDQTTQDVYFDHGEPYEFAIEDPTDTNLDNPANVVVKILDAFGNHVDNFETDVTLNVTGGTGNITGNGLLDITQGIGSLDIGNDKAETVILRVADSQGAGLVVTSTQDLVFSQGAAIKYKILDPNDGTVDSPITITIQALDQYNNVDTSYSGVVTLVASGSVTGEGPVSLSGGVGTIAIEDSVPETVDLSLTGGDLDNSSVEDVVFASGVVKEIVILDPGTASVDAPAVVTVNALDQHGNLATYFQENITLLVTGDAVVSANGLIDITNGVGTINVTDEKAETVFLTLSNTEGISGTIDITSSEDIYFEPGAVTDFVIQNPTDSTVGSPALVDVYALDQYGNLATYYNQADAGTLETTGNATGGSTFSMTAGVGSLFINDLTTETVELSLLNSAPLTGIDFTSTEDLYFGPAAADRYVIVDPIDVTVDNVAVIKIEARDPFGNVDPNFDGVVTLDYTGKPSGTVACSPDTDCIVTVTNGVGQINMTDTMAETLVLSLSADNPDLTNTSTEDIIFKPGAATKFVITDAPDGTVDNPIAVTVEAQDQFGNRSTNYNNDVTLQADGSATGDGLVNISFGLGSLDISNTVSETVNLTLADSQGTTLDVTSTEDIFFDHGVPHHYDIVDPVDGNIDADIDLVINLVDQHGNVTIGEADHTVDLSSDSTTMTADTNSTNPTGYAVTISSGTATVALNNSTAESVTLSLANGLGGSVLEDDTEDVIFAIGQIDRIVIIDPTDGDVDSPVTVTVHALDSGGNIVTFFDSDVTLASTGSATIDNFGLINITQGVGTINISNTKMETVELSLVNSQGLNASINLDSTQDLYFDHGAADHFGFVEHPDGVVGVDANIEIEARDQHGNRVNDHQDDVDLTTGGSANGDGTINIVDGYALVLVQTLVEETVLMELSNGGTLSTSEPDSSQEVFFQAAVATRFVVIDPVDVTTDQVATIRVEAQDDNGNRDSSFTGDATVTFVNTTPTTLTCNPANCQVSLTNGWGEITLANTFAETVVVGVADDVGPHSLDDSSSQELVFNPGTPSMFTIINPTDGTIDAAIPVTIEAQDQYGNRVYGYDSSVTLNVDSSTVSGDGVITITDGAGIAPLENTTRETVNMTLTDSASTNLDVNSTEDVFFDWGTPVAVRIADPADATVIETVTITLHVVDAAGNIVGNYGGSGENVDLDLSGSAFNNPTNVTFTNGVGQVQIEDHKAETVELTLTDGNTALDTDSTTQDIVFTHGPMEKYTVIDPADDSISNPIPVTVQAQDIYGNRVFTWNNDVSLVAGGSASGDGVVNIIAGQGTLSLTNSVAETVSLTLADTSNTTKDVTSSENVVFQVGLPHHYAIINPDDKTTDEVGSITVEVHDLYGNFVSTYNENVMLVAIGTDPNVDSTATATGEVVITNGTGTISIASTVAETIALTLQDTTPGATQALEWTSTEDIVFTAGAFVGYAITDPEDGTVAAPIQIEILAVDAGGNQVTSFSGSVTLTADGNAGGEGPVSLTGGSGYINLTNTVVETVNLALTGPSPAGDVSSTQDVFFDHGPAFEFAFASATDATVDSAAPIQIQVHDLYGNLVDDYVGDGVTLISDSTTTFSTAEGAAAGAPILVNFTNGEYILDLEDSVSETVNLYFSDTEGTNLFTVATTQVFFDAGVPYQFAVLDPGEASVDFPQIVTIEAQDQWGNKITGYTGSVQVMVDGDATLPGPTNSLKVDLADGEANISVANTTSETIWITMSDDYFATNPAPGNMDVSSSQDLFFNFGSVNKIVIIDPNDTSTDLLETVRIEAQDQFDNMVPIFSGDVTLVQNGDAVFDPADGHAVITGGFAELPIYDRTAQTIILSLANDFGLPEPPTFGGIDFTSTQDMIFEAGIPVAFEMDDPTDVDAGQTTVLDIRAIDQWGNTATSYNGNVVVQADTGRIDNIGEVTLVNGELSITIGSEYSETHWLTFGETDPVHGLNMDSSQDVYFNPGAATRLIVVDPGTVSVDDNPTVSVWAVDDLGNIAPSWFGTVKLEYANESTAPICDPGDCTVTLSAGTGQINLKHTVAETLELTLSTLNQTAPASPIVDILGTTEDIVYKHGVASQYVILTPPIDATVDSIATLQVEAQDQYGNRAFDWQFDIQLYVNGDASPADQKVDIINGLGTVGLNDSTVETVDLWLDDDYGTTLTHSSTNEIFFDVGKVRKFVIQPPGDSTVDTTNHIVTVWATDQFGNKVESYQDNVTLVESGNALFDNYTVPDSIVMDIVDGEASITIENHTSESVRLSLLSDQGATDADGGVMDASSTQWIFFDHGVAYEYVVDDPLDTTTVDSTSVQVRVVDRFGNTCTDNSDNIELVLSGNALGGGMLNINNGVSARLITDTLAETVSITLANPANASLLYLDASQDVVFNPGPPVKFGVLTSTNNIVGNDATAYIQIQDVYGNRVFGESATTSVTVDGGAYFRAPLNGTQTESISITDGEASILIYSETAETVTVTALTDATLLEGDGDLVFIGGAIDQIVLDDPNGGLPAKVDFTVIANVRAIDQFGNTAVGYDGTVDLTTTGSARLDTLNPLISINLTNGKGTVSIEDDVIETVNLTLSNPNPAAPGGLGLPQDLVFIIGDPNKVIFSEDIYYGDTTTSMELTLYVTDSKDNIITWFDYPDGVEVFSSSPNVTGLGLVSFDNGVGTLNIDDNVAETAYLSLGTNGINDGGDALIVLDTAQASFAPGVADKIVIVTQGFIPEVEIGATYSAKLEAQDAFGNKVTAYNGTIHFYADQTGATPNDEVLNFTNGQALTTVLENTPGTVNMWLADTEGESVAVGPTQQVIFVPGAPTKIFISPTTEQYTNKEAIITILVLDNGNNVVDYNGSVELVIGGTGNFTGAGEVILNNGIGTVSLTDDIPETLSLSLLDTYGTGLNVDSTEEQVFLPVAVDRIVIFGDDVATENQTYILKFEAQDAGGAAVNTANCTTRLVGTSTGSQASSVVSPGVAVNIVDGKATEPIIELADVGTVTYSLENINCDVTQTDTHEVLFEPQIASAVVPDTLGTPVVSIGSENQLRLMVVDQNGYEVVGFGTTVRVRYEIDTNSSVYCAEDGINFDLQTCEYRISNGSMFIYTYGRTVEYDVPTQVRDCGVALNECSDLPDRDDATLLYPRITYIGFGVPPIHHFSFVALAGWGEWGQMLTQDTTGNVELYIDGIEGNGNVTKDRGWANNLNDHTYIRVIAYNGDDTVVNFSLDPGVISPDPYVPKFYEADGVTVDDGSAYISNDSNGIVWRDGIGTFAVRDADQETVMVAIHKTTAGDLAYVDDQLQVVFEREMPHHIEFEGIPSSIEAGSTFPITLKAYLADGTVDTGFNSTSYIVRTFYPDTVGNNMDAEFCMNARPFPGGGAERANFKGWDGPVDDTGTDPNIQIPTYDDEDNLHRCENGKYMDEYPIAFVNGVATQEMYFYKAHPAYKIRMDYNHFTRPYWGPGSSYRSYISPNPLDPYDRPEVLAPERTRFSDPGNVYSATTNRCLPEKIVCGWGGCTCTMYTPVYPLEHPNQIPIIGQTKYLAVTPSDPAELNFYTPFNIHATQFVAGDPLATPPTADDNSGTNLKRDTECGAAAARCINNFPRDEVILTNAVDEQEWESPGTWAIYDQFENIRTNDSDSVVELTTWDDENCTVNTDIKGTLQNTGGKVYNGLYDTVEQSLDWDEYLYPNKIAETFYMKADVPASGALTEHCTGPYVVWSKLRIIERDSFTWTPTSYSIHWRVLGGVPPISDLRMIDNVSGGALYDGASCGAGCMQYQYRAGKRGGSISDTFTANDSAWSVNSAAAGITIFGAHFRHEEPSANWADFGNTGGVDTQKAIWVNNIGTNVNIVDPPCMAGTGGLGEPECEPDTAALTRDDPYVMSSGKISTVLYDGPGSQGMFSFDDWQCLSTDTLWRDEVPPDPYFGPNFPCSGYGLADSEPSYCRYERKCKVIVKFKPNDCEQAVANSGHPDHAQAVSEGWTCASGPHQSTLHVEGEQGGIIDIILKGQKP